jgi:hypothetical protein
MPVPFQSESISPGVGGRAVAVASSLHTLVREDDGAGIDQLSAEVKEAVVDVWRGRAKARWG